MNCIFLRCKQKKGLKFLYCKTKKKKISFEGCKNCSLKQFKVYKKMKNKSQKLKQAEQKRYSIFTSNLKICFMCDLDGKQVKKADLHEVYGGSNRQRSIKNGFVKIICRKCHDDEKEIIKLRKETQLEYEKNHTREEFIQLIGKSYLINGEEKKWQKEECSQKP